MVGTFQISDGINLAQIAMSNQYEEGVYLDQLVDLMYNNLQPDKKSATSIPFRIIGNFYFNGNKGGS